ncbi:enoyl-CoA hydratase/isomerase family protein [Caballeronia sp. SEWSISQ10-4 2]|uniref:enoyl-CoA hydratase/isomerase family protein n=1 Tax=Caballeronia sp. SEWSISQ10-4 2 TaxID=2937438 RepID=UPI00264ACA93|nr:enoyl-CoA hydratase/isomerase family protein [Caballeronia sp. SEWSISQ10-4 2]MDN7177009.1 enoyl-CoA hydratase/isomerase family protein [Caballeronia sp. SEWSISQ10-4 2]
MKTIEYSVRDGIAEISMSRPPANALDEAMLVDLLAALRRAAGDRDTRAVILHSAISGRFCAGLDLKVASAAGAEQLYDVTRKLYIELFDVQFNLGKPSISAVAGAARGGGMTVAVSSDMIVAAESATFGYPEIDSGLLPAIHYVHLPRVVGRQRAFDLLFTGRTFSATEAFSLGLINRVVPDDEVLDAARAIARTLASKPPEAVRRGRAAFMSALDQNYRREIAAAVENFCNVANGEEARERLTAFAERHKPTWKNSG